MTQALSQKMKIGHPNGMFLLNFAQLKWILNEFVQIEGIPSYNLALASRLFEETCSTTSHKLYWLLPKKRIPHQNYEISVSKSKRLNDHLKSLFAAIANRLCKLLDKSFFVSCIFYTLNFKIYNHNFLSQPCKFTCTSAFFKL